MDNQSIGLKELLLPLFEGAVGRNSPLLGIGLRVSRSVAASAATPQARDTAGGIYTLLFLLGAGVLIDRYCPD